MVASISLARGRRQGNAPAGEDGGEAALRAHSVEVHDFSEVLERAAPTECVPVSAKDPLYILYTHSSPRVSLSLSRRDSL